MHLKHALVPAAISTALATFVHAGVIVSYGVAELAAFGTAAPPVQSSVSVNWPGPIGALTVRVPPVGTQNVTRVDLSDFTDAGLSLTASGSGKWSALVGFRFSVDTPSIVTITGQIFGNPGLNLLGGVSLEDLDSGTTLFSIDASGASFDSGSLTLQAGVEYSLVYHSNYGLGGGTGQGSLLGLTVTAIPEPQAVATACLAGILFSRRRHERPAYA